MSIKFEDIKIGDLVTWSNSRLIETVVHKENSCDLTATITLQITITKADFDQRNYDVRYSPQNKSISMDRE